MSGSQNKTECFCPMPFNSLVIDYAGYSGPCPNNGSEYGQNSVGLKSNWANSKILNLQTGHLEFKKPKACIRCYTEDKIGLKTLRHFANEYFYPDFLNSSHSKNYHLGPKQLVLRLSNICNFACRTCNSRNSSLYLKEGQHYAEKYNDTKSEYSQIRPIKEFSESDMLQFFELCSQVEKLQFFGGEPMLNKTHHVLLKKLIESGRAQNIELFYCTNGSVFPDEKLKAIWKEFKGIVINFSIDAIENEFEFIRWPGKWPSVSENILKFKDLGSQLNGHLKLSATVTVSILNIWSIDQTMNWLKANIGVGDYLTLAHKPEYYCVQNLPEESKKRVTEHLSELPNHKDYQFIIDFMNSQSSNFESWKSFVLWTEKKDLYRRVRFSEVFSSYYQILAIEYQKVALEFTAST